MTSSPSCAAPPLWTAASSHPSRADTCTALPDSLALWAWTADKALLHHAHRELPVAREDRPLRQAAAGAGPRRLLVVEPPLVGPERPVKPHRVVQARPDDVAAAPGAPVRHERRVEKRHVAGEGDHADVQEGVVRQRSVSPHPDLAARPPAAGVLGHPRRIADVAHINRPGPGEPA